MVITGIMGIFVMWTMVFSGDSGKCVATMMGASRIVIVLAYINNKFSVCAGIDYVGYRYFFAYAGSARSARHDTW
jgi:hypothetical protein